MLKRPEDERLVAGVEVLRELGEGIEASRGAGWMEFAKREADRGAGFDEKRIACEAMPRARACVVRPRAVRRVRSSTPGVTDTPFARAVRLASSFLPAARCTLEPGPMKTSPACSMAAASEPGASVLVDPLVMAQA